MRVVVTGASGNVGTALRRALAGLGADVVCVARRVPESAAGSPPPRTAGSAASGTETWVGCDVGAPAADVLLREVFAGADAVVHLAWAVQPGPDDPPMRRTNLDGSAHVLAAAAGVPHVVVASSVAAYTPARHVVDETWPCDGVPGSAYSLHKARLEHLLDQYDGAPVARIRPCAVVQPEAGAELDRWALSPLVPPGLLRKPWLPVPLWSGLRAQVVHADDVARAIVVILLHGAEGAFNVAGEPLLDADDLARTFGGFRLPVPLPVLTALAWPTWRLGLQPLHPGWLRLADRASIVDTTRLRALGWEPRHDAREALAEFVAAVAEGRGSWGPLAPRGGSRLGRLGWGRPLHQSQGG
ncbi:NAD-dependent epimerase/dehydratase family protein [Saccharothrix variisporea]|uniref:Nucleoside-diphosphate-sugar epimerase n=1 Tax=Saccharothrix variisporea TaxID=543527 RepID=A0A495X853_9PSEU|nr:NAD-dependent epimerase/dehydratase family protein [Saccharothrix variisporea]RKT68853.1 nucleoside-diphosphate-sugar epimerase [Saccharothrix variisporea]